MAPSDGAPISIPRRNTGFGEPAEIIPYLGSSRLAEVVDRHQADMVLHGHAHHSAADGKTTGYRIFDI